jgi:hypothetical protein
MDKKNKAQNDLVMFTSSYSWLKGAWKNFASRTACSSVTGYKDWLSRISSGSHHGTVFRM